MLLKYNISMNILQRNLRISLQGVASLLDTNYFMIDIMWDHIIALPINNITWTYKHLGGHCHVYYKNRALLMAWPLEVMIIIHDKWIMQRLRAPVLCSLGLSHRWTIETFYLCHIYISMFSIQKLGIFLKAGIFNLFTSNV